MLLKIQETNFFNHQRKQQTLVALDPTKISHELEIDTVNTQYLS